MPRRCHCRHRRLQRRTRRCGTGSRSFSTGKVIIPRVCSDLRLNLALEQYFGIKRPMRYIPVDGGVRTRFAVTANQVHGHAVQGGDSRLPERVGVKELTQRLAASPGEAAVVHALVAYLAGEFDRGGFIRLKEGAACGVQAAGEGVLLPEFSGCAVEGHLPPTRPSATLSRRARL